MVRNELGEIVIELIPYWLMRKYRCLECGEIVTLSDMGIHLIENHWDIVEQYFDVVEVDEE